MLEEFELLFYPFPNLKLGWYIPQTLVQPPPPRHNNRRAYFFWKCGSRKIYAVKTNPRGTKRLNKSKEKIISHYDVSDDSDDEFVSKSKKAKLVTSTDLNN